MEKLPCSQSCFLHLIIINLINPIRFIRFSSSLWIWSLTTTTEPLIWESNSLLMVIWVRSHMAGTNKRIVDLLQWVRRFSRLGAPWLDIIWRTIFWRAYTMVKKYFAAGVFFSFCLVFWGRTLTLGSKISLPGSKRVKTMRLPFVFQEEQDPLWRLMIRRITLRSRSVSPRSSEFLLIFL